jgi:hypothetical protein
MFCFLGAGEDKLPHFGQKISKQPKNLKERFFFKFVFIYLFIYLFIFMAWVVLLTLKKSKRDFIKCNPKNKLGFLVMIG